MDITPLHFEHDCEESLSINMDTDSWIELTYNESVVLVVKVHKQGKEIVLQNKNPTIEVRFDNKSVI